MIFSDERNHASLIDGARLSRASRVVFPHNDLDELTRLLARSGEAAGTRSSSSSRCSAWTATCRRWRSTRSCAGRPARRSIVDEAHAVGVYGARGSGLIEASGIERDVCVSINTAGKALGVSGAFVAGPAWAIDYLIQRARPFIFSTAPPPALAAALDASLDLVASEPERRARLADARRVPARRAERGRRAGARRVQSQIVPIVLGDNDRALLAADALQARGFDVRAIRPPTVPPGTARLRISVNVGLAEETHRPVRGARWPSTLREDAFRAPRPLRNRHRHRRRQDGRVGGADAPLPRRLARSATGSRFRPASSRTMTRRGGAAGRRAARRAARRRGPAAASACRRIWPRSLTRHADRCSTRSSIAVRAEPAVGALDRRRRRRRAGADQRARTDGRSDVARSACRSSSWREPRSAPSTTRC